jgi:phosphoribosylformylglycinamidine synthase subunit PurS
MPIVRVTVTLKPALLDSAGRTVADSLHRMGYDEVLDARVGKVIDLKVASVDEQRIRAMCDELLANPVIESFSFEVLS